MIQILDRIDFIEKLKQVIKIHFDDNVTNFARKAGIHPSRMHDYLKGGCFPKADKLKKIIHAAGMSIVELYGESPGEHPVPVGEIIPYTGPERRRDWPYTPEEREYIDMLISILRGKNKYNKKAIIENIKAFYKTRDVEIPLEVKKAEGV